MRGFVRRTRIICVDEFGDSTDGLGFRAIGFLRGLRVFDLGERTCGIHDAHFRELLDELVAHFATRPEIRDSGTELVFGLTRE